MHVEEVRELSDALLLALRELALQLSPSAAPLTRERLHEIVAGSCCRLLVARDSGGGVCGMLILVSYPIATGRRFWIEDVAVAPGARGRGTGEALVRRAIELARAAGAHALDLTCRPSREAANRLYARVGFDRRETNVYRLELSAPAAPG